MKKKKHPLSFHGAAGMATAAAAAATASLCAARGVYCASLLVRRDTSDLRWPSGVSYLSAGMTDTERSCLVTLKTTMPSETAKRVSSVPRPTSVPGWNCFGGDVFGGGGGKVEEEREEEVRKRPQRKREEKKKGKEKKKCSNNARRIVRLNSLS